MGLSLIHIFVAATLGLHRGWLTEAKVSGYFANGLTFGRVQMVAVNRVLGIIPIDLLRTVGFEARLALWRVAMVAVLRGMRTLKALSLIHI